MEKFKVTPFKTEKQESKSLFPLPLRCLVVGKSGSGKTTLLWNIITKYWIPYENLYIFTKSIDQPIYQKLEEIFENILEVETNFLENCSDITPIDDCQPNSLVVFDDCILEKQGPIKEYFVRSRHKNISCIYISQCYSMVDLRVIRTNLNFLIIFEQSNHYVTKIWEDFIGSDMTLEEFKNLCFVCWKKKYGFLTIDLINRRYYNQFTLC